MGPVFGFFTLLLAAFIILKGLYFPFKLIYSFAEYKWGYLKPYSKYEKSVITIVLQKNFQYYKDLSQGGKNKFLKRTMRIMRSFEFVGKEDQIININVKILISSAIAQVTFGLDHYDLQSTSTIYVYPNVFRINEKDPLMRGANAPNGKLYFSWKHLIKGYAIEDDGVNLAFHEIAHAVMNEYFAQGLTFSYSYRYLNWVEVAQPIFKEMKENNSRGYLFRARATVNLHEFWAVAVENFFERPRLFLQRHPKLFQETCKLLDQNPLNARNNYNLKEKNIYLS
jgi:Mlc titration factor MtfA (ptsG expression regulator)